jgi:hypothetical protein
MMNYEKRKYKYVFEKDGVYFALTLEQIDDMTTTLAEIQKKERPVFKCTIYGEDDQLDTCTWDEGNTNDCCYSAQGIKKEDCKYWKAI